MRNFAPIFCPDCLGSLICGLCYIEESLVGTFFLTQTIRQVANLIEHFLF